MRRWCNITSISITDYKNDLITSFINCNNIVELLDSQQSGIYSNDDLIYKNIFPFMRIFETQTIADCYLMISVDITNISRYNPTYAIYKTTVWIMSHNDRMKVKNRSGTRIDLLSEEIKILFDGSMKFGFSPFELNANREIILNNTYVYRELVFTCNELRNPVSTEGKRNR